MNRTEGHRSSGQSSLRAEEPGAKLRLAGPTPPAHLILVNRRGKGDESDAESAHDARNMRAWKNSSKYVINI